MLVKNGENDRNEHIFFSIFHKLENVIWQATLYNYLSLLLHMFLIYEAKDVIWQINTTFYRLLCFCLIDCVEK